MSGISPHHDQAELVNPTPVYRVVFTTLQTIFADGEVFTEGALIRWGNGSVIYGYTEAPDAFPGRDAATFVMPERGTLVPTETGRWRYESRGTVRRYDGGSGADLSKPGPVSHQYSGGTLDDVFFVELIVEIEDTAPKAAALAQGRRRAAPIKALLDLFFGPRLLAAQSPRSSDDSPKTATTSRWPSLTA